MSKVKAVKGFEYLIEKAVENQLMLNDKMKNKKWRDANLKFYRACWFECAEKLEHINWEWWKHRGTNMSQVYLESADILHFLISATYMKHYGSLKDDKQATHATVAELSDAIEQSTQSNIKVSDELDVEAYCQAIETYIAAVLSTKHGCPKVFFDTCTRLHLSFENLFKLYFAKSVLNNFRQDHGDKEGSYDRKWYLTKDKTVSDNEILYDLSITTKMNDKFKEHLYEHLEKAYETHHSIVDLKKKLIL